MPNNYCWKLAVFLFAILTIATRLVDSIEFETKLIQLDEDHQVVGLKWTKPSTPIKSKDNSSVGEVDTLIGSLCTESKLETGKNDKKNKLDYNNVNNIGNVGNKKDTVTNNNEKSVGNDSSNNQNNVSNDSSNKQNNVSNDSSNNDSKSVTCEKLFYYFIDDELVILIDSNFNQYIQEIQENYILINKQLFDTKNYTFNVVLINTQAADFISTHSIPIDINKLNSTGVLVSEESRSNFFYNQIDSPSDPIYSNNFNIMMPSECTANNYTIRWEKQNSSRTDSNSAAKTVFSITIRDNNQPSNKLFEIAQDKTEIFEFTIKTSLNSTTNIPSKKTENEIESDPIQTVTIKGKYEDGLLEINNPTDLVNTSIQIYFLTYNDGKKFLMTSTQPIDFSKCLLTKDEHPVEDSTKNLYIIVGSVVGSILLICLSLMALMIYRRRARGKTSQYIRLEDYENNHHYLELLRN